jgi:hypothetical protein
MSFASSKDVIQVYQKNLSQTTLPSNIVILMFNEVLPEGTYFLSYSPYMTASANFNTITCWIGSGFNTGTENEVSSIFDTPYNYTNMAYFTPSMSGAYVSDGVTPLVIRLSANVASSGTYNAFVPTSGSYDFNYIRLS